MDEGDEEAERPPAWLRLVRRRALADLLAVEVEHARPLRRAADHGLVASVSVQVTLDSEKDAGVVLDEAGQVARDGGAGSVESRSSGGALVFLIHGEWWSVVFPLLPFTGLMLICLDDLPENCLQVYDDSPHARTALRAVHDAVIMRMRTQLPITNLDLVSGVRW
jgi:hypothetical protein